MFLVNKLRNTNTNYWTENQLCRSIIDTCIHQTKSLPSSSNLGIWFITSSNGFISIVRLATCTTMASCRVLFDSAATAWALWHFWNSLVISLIILFGGRFPTISWYSFSRFSWSYMNQKFFKHDWLTTTQNNYG